MDEAAAAYARAAIAHASAIADGDSSAANRAHELILAALRELRSGTDRGQSRLEYLAGRDQSAVQVWAATHLLPLNEPAALSILTRLKSESGEFEFEASVTINEWKAGKLKVP